MKNSTGEEIEIEIEKLVAEGKGFVKTNGKPLFVPLSVPKDKLIVRITTSKKNYSEGEIKRILKPSPSRTDPICPLYGECGGCNFQHISIAERESYLNAVLKENLERIGKIKTYMVNILDPFISCKQFNYRLRGKFKCHFKNNSFYLGFLKRKSNNIVNVDYCYLMSEEINNLIKILKTCFKKYKSDKDSLFEVQLISINNKSAAIFNFEKKDTALLTFLREHNFFDYLELRIKNKRSFSYPENFFFIFQEQKVHPCSFIQCNPEVNRKIRNDIMKFINRDSSILDLYCGHGNLSLEIAKSGSYVLGIEENPTSLSFLKNVNNYKAVRDSVSKAIKTLSRKEFSTIILDPPRAGIFDISKTLLEFNASRIIYLSCDSATLCRDLGILQEKYSIVNAQVYDMFPQTSHFETMIVLENKAFITNN